MAWAFTAAGLVNGALVGAILLLRGLRGSNRPAAMLGAIILLATAAASLILATDQVPRQVAPLSHLTGVLLTLAAGPLLIVIVRHLLGRKVPWLALGASMAVALPTVGAATSGPTAPDPLRTSFAGVAPDR